MKLYIVGKITPNLDTRVSSVKWSFQGVFTSKKKAEEACKNKNFFVGPCVLNQEINMEDTIWPDAYYPKQSFDIESR